MAGISSMILWHGSQLPWPWTPSGTSDMGNLLGQHPLAHWPATFSEDFFPSKGVVWCRKGRLAPLYWSLWDLDLSSFFQSHVVTVKEEATTLSNAWTEALTSSLFCIETTTTFILGMISHKTYKPFQPAKIDPSFFLRWVGETSSSGPNYSVH